MPPAEGSVPLLGVASTAVRTDGAAPSELDLQTDAGRGFTFVIVFPLPEVATAQEEKEFKKHLAPGQRCVDLLRECTHCFEDDTSFKLACDDTLASIRTATIEIFKCLFETLIASHSKGNPDDDSEIYCFTSVDRDELFMCIRLSDAVVEVLADMMDYPVQLNKESLQALKILISGNQRKDLVTAYVKYDAFQKEQDFLVKYDRGLVREYYTILPSKDRIRLIFDRIVTYINLPELIRLGLVSHAYPNHTQKINSQLRETWANLKLVYTTDMPMDKIREYFGEEVAFYFLFVGRLGVAVKFLIPVTTIYALVAHYWSSSVDVQSGVKDAPRVIYASVLLLWFFVFIKHWRRTETHWANKWGVDREMAYLKLGKVVNPHFNGVSVGSDVDESRTVLAPIKWKRQLGLAWAVVIESSFHLLVMILLLCLQVSYTNFHNCENPKLPPCSDEQLQLMGIYVGHWGATVVSVLLSITIKLLNFFWTYVAEMLCHAEQHVLLLDWYAARTSKIFRFQFISTFFAFFVLTALPTMDDSPRLAALWGWHDTEPHDAIMNNSRQALSASLKINFYIYVAFGILDMAIPYGTMHWRMVSERRAMAKTGTASFKLSHIERQAKMLEYTGADAADDYMAIIFPMGFVVLFSVAMPLFASLLMFVVVSSQIRADAWKFISAYRRPFPEMVQGIRVWNSWLEVLVWFAIALNAFQVTTCLEIEYMVTKLFPFMKEHYRKDPDLMEFGEFFGYAGFFILVRLLLDNLIDDVDAKTKLERRRQALQRLNLSEFLNSEQFAEKVSLRCTGKTEVKQWAKTPRLKPGDRRFL